MYLILLPGPCLFSKKYARKKNKSTQDSIFNFREFLSDPSAITRIEKKNY